MSIWFFSLHMHSRMNFSALNNAAALMQPCADYMAKKFGAKVSILMVCPIGNKQGEVELRR